MLTVSQTKTIDKDPLAWLQFTEDAIITSCKSGKNAAPTNHGGG